MKKNLNTNRPRTKTLKLNIKELRPQVIVLLFGFIVVLNLLYPTPFPRKFSLKPGDIAPRDIIAPYTFYIRKSKSELEEERERAKESVFFVLLKNDEQSHLIKKNADEFFHKLDTVRAAQLPLREKRAELLQIMPSLSKEEIGFLLTKDYTLLKDSLLKILDEVLEQGIIEDRSKIKEPVVVILGEEKLRSVEEFLPLKDLPIFLNSRATQIFKTQRSAINTFVALGTVFIKPNLFPQPEETFARKEAAAAQVSPTKGIVRKGEIIVRAHDVVTPEVIEKLNSLPIEASTTRIYTFIGRNVIYLLACLILFLYLYSFTPALFNDLLKVFLLLLLMCIIMGAASIIIRANLSWYLLPIALFGVLASLLLGNLASVVGVIILTILISVYSGGGVEPIAIFLFGGITSIFAATNVKKPSDFYKSTICITTAYIFTAVGAELIKFTPVISLLKSVAYAIAGGAGASFVAFGLLPVFEKSFKITTPITLLEYANPDHPILQELATYAPGTYHHSMIVATLAEQGARIVGAYPLLARVGAYYHDIGKLKRPEYFIENQRPEANPHSKLNPELNARIVISHVRDGVEMAQKEGLPREIIDIIREHHGTSMVESFYLKAKQTNREDVDELDFRYPGPLPHTKEAAIVMLADAVEAAVRGLQEFEPHKIKGVIENTFAKKIEDGQLALVNFSGDELKRIENSFLPIVVSLFHQRNVQYEESLHKKTKKRQNHTERSSGT